MGYGEDIFVEESTIDFPIFLLFFNANFPIFNNNNNNNNNSLY